MNKCPRCGWCGKATRKRKLEEARKERDRKSLLKAWKLAYGYREGDVPSEEVIEELREVIWSKREKESAE